MFTTHDRSVVAEGILILLKEAGVEALVVGGLARDILLGVKAQGGDIDIVIPNGGDAYNAADKVLSKLAEQAEQIFGVDVRVNRFEHYDDSLRHPLVDEDGEMMGDGEYSDFDARIAGVLRLEFNDGANAGMHIDIIGPTVSALPTGSPLTVFLDTFDFNVNQCYGELEDEVMTCRWLCDEAPEVVELLANKAYYPRLIDRYDHLAIKLMDCGLDWHKAHAQLSALQDVQNAKVTLPIMLASDDCPIRIKPRKG